MIVRHRKGLCGVKWFVIYTCVMQYRHSTVQLVTSVYSRTSHSSVELVTAAYTCSWSQQYSTGHSSVKFAVTIVSNLLQGYRTSHSSSVELATAYKTRDLLQQYKARNSNIKYLTVYYLL